MVTQMAPVKLRGSQNKKAGIQGKRAVGRRVYKYRGGIMGVGSNQKALCMYEIVNKQI